MKRRNEVLVGVLLTVAIVLAITGTLWLARGGLASGYPLYSRFKWGQNLKQGQPVLLAGIAVGYVDDVQLRDAGFLDVKFRVQDQYKVPRGTTASVQPNGIFGDVLVALDPPKHLSGAYYNQGDTIPPGPDAVSVAQLMNRVDTMSRSVNLLISTLQTEMVANGGIRDIRRTIASTNQLVAELNAVASQQNRNATAVMASFQRAADKAGAAIDTTALHATLANLQQTSANSARLTSELTTSSQQLTAILANIEHGNGTAGKLLTDTLLYRDVRNLVGRMDSLTTDFQKNPRKYVNLSIF